MPMESLAESPTREVTPTWPPPFSVRLSKKAKHVHLKIWPTKGLEIVVPFRQRKMDINELLADKRSWIERNLTKIQLTEKLKPTKINLPCRIHLTSIHETWHIIYIAKNQTQIRIKEQQTPLGPILILSGPTDDFAQTTTRLKQWLQNKAKNHLIPWLYHISEQSNLPFEKASIRSQKTLWGSCNSKKHINLNCKLLFLSAELVQHLMLHELSHTKHLNHSPRFWKLLTKLDPNCDQHNQQLRVGDNYLPDWLTWEV